MRMLTAVANGGACRRFRFRLPLLVGCCIDDDDLKGAAAVGGGSLGCNNGESSFASLFIETLALCNFSVEKCKNTRMSKKLEVVKMLLLPSLEALCVTMRHQLCPGGIPGAT